MYKKINKYRNHKTTIDGITFDSKKEAQRYLALKEMQENGEICDLKRQVEWVLIPSQKTSTETLRPVKYRADFTYYKDGKLIVEDVKGVKTPEYKIKRKLMYEKHGIEVVEI